ncbi:hypothetical protein A3L11_07420 [Thermococcus siculi]|uniref:Uncharacterized protein n=1 Tax=Thermococcus siculi TaxID=72803 RepID=A0A2Z2MTB5_9EURY|nr:hypothetical protein [Thermococcus siculi]ASJ09066.1 hypothetical protein A3L11_07420 [Thermococcus siculi]
MRGRLVLIVMLVGLLMPYAGATTIAVDISHGEGTTALVSPIVDPTSGEVVAKGIIPTLSWYRWAYFGYDSELEDAGALRLGGRITYSSLKDVDVLIIGHLRKPLSDDEVEAIVRWFSEGGRVLWISGDSDISGGAYAQDNANRLLAAIPGAKLRIDYATATDTFSNAGKSAYVSGFVRPDLHTPDASMLNEGYLSETGKVLFHEPGLLAWVDKDGKWHPLIVGEIPDGVYRIVTTSSNGMVEDNYAPEPRAYQVWEKGLLTLLAVEFVELPNGAEGLLIVSGESPYGGQVPIWINRYGPYLFDGQRFVSNLLKWAVKQSYGLKKAETSTSTTVTTSTEKTTSRSTTTITPTASSIRSTASTPSQIPEEETTTEAKTGGISWIYFVAFVLVLSAAVMAFLVLRRR